MSRLAYHVAHFKSNNVNGIGLHNWEKRGEYDRHSNQDIDTSRSYLNVQLIEQNKSLYRTIKQDIEDRCKGRVTAHSNWLSETITYPPENIQNNREQCISFFRDVLNWHQLEFDITNVKSAVIHFDETTPHMHTNIIPLTRDGRLSSKDIFTRKNLNRHHTELAAYLKERGWEVERGESTKDKQIRSKSVPEYKKEAEKQRIILLGEVEILERKRDTLQEEIDKADAWLNQIPGWPEYEAESNRAWDLLEGLRKLLQATFCSKSIFRDKKGEKIILKAVESARDCVKLSISGLSSYEVQNNIPYHLQRSRVIVKSLDEMIYQVKKQRAKEGSVREQIKHRPKDKDLEL